MTEHSPDYGKIPSVSTRRGVFVDAVDCPAQAMAVKLRYDLSRAYCVFNDEKCSCYRGLVSLDQQYTQCKALESDEPEEIVETQAAETRTAFVEPRELQRLTLEVSLEAAPGLIRDLAVEVLSRYAERRGYTPAKAFAIHHATRIRRALEKVVTRALPHFKQQARSHSKQIVDRLAGKIDSPEQLIEFTKHLFCEASSSPALGFAADLAIRDVVLFVYEKVEREGKKSDDSSLVVVSGLIAPVTVLSSRLRQKHSLKHLVLSHDDQRGVLTIRRLEVLPKSRGKGKAKATMKDLMSWADRHQTVLAAEPTSAYGANKARLAKSLLGLGFRRNRGTGARFDISASLVRIPNSTRSTTS